MKNLIRRTAFFTMVELLIVISIILILTSILMPALGKARERSKQIKCAGNQRQIGQIINFYANDYNEWLVPCFAAEGLWITIINNADLGIPIKQCDSYSKAYSEQGIWTCPSNKYRYYTYLVNYAPSNRAGWTYNASYNFAWQKLSTVKKSPSELVYFAEGGRMESKCTVSSPYYCYYYFSVRTDTVPYMHYSDAVVHSKSSNYLFLDGHVENINYGDKLIVLTNQWQ
ncbi:MAG: hypothetical protein A2017_09185 [Lentisphaerae bacterium GWF2_44_16]|nr:MAG: hypothetical protein A2017_09185 [Lentisphaerae bacterium GWF2_44_16]